PRRRGALGRGGGLVGGGARAHPEQQQVGGGQHGQQQREHAVAPDLAQFGGKQAHFPSPSPNTARYTSSSPWPGAYFLMRAGTGAASTIWPARSRITSVATVSTSLTTWVATRIMRSAAILASSSRRRTRSLGSRPAVGSSRISGLGWPGRAAASSSRCFMPPE